MEVFALFSFFVAVVFPSFAGSVWVASRIRIIDHIRHARGYAEFVAFLTGPPLTHYDSTTRHGLLAI